MKAVQQFVSVFRNSPTFARDRVNLISSFTIGFAALVLNGSVLLAVLILLFDPREFSGLAKRVEFGQLLGILLLSGATIFATLLIPLRLSGVFLGPRIGRYFDQVVLTGISPVRFLMGKVTSQNLFLALMLFLLLPWFILVLVVGGLDWYAFLGNLLLLWLYCMMLALVMIWLSLYFNEILSLMILLSVAAIVCLLGATPIPYQPFVLTPFPALLMDSYQLSTYFPPEYLRSYGSIFLSSLLVMGTVCVAAFTGICIGPLYGIVRDNSTFGEVVHAGDSRRKRWFRFRHHIQRPSEIAFFYQNRSHVFRSWEGLLRWGTTLLVLLGLMGVAWGLYSDMVFMQYQVIRKSPSGSFYSYFYMEANARAETIHGFTVIIAAIVFNHARNTVCCRIPFLAGRKVSISRLDWISFLFLVTLSSLLCYGIPAFMNEVYRLPNEPVGVPGPGFQDQTQYDWYAREYGNMNIWHVHLESTVVVSVSALALYVFLRTLCLLTWLRTLAVFVGVVAYSVVCLLGPFLLALLVRFLVSMEFEMTREWAWIAMMSPVAVFGVIYREMPGDVMDGQSTLPFYVVHLLLIAAFWLIILRVGAAVEKASRSWQARGEAT